MAAASVAAACPTVTVHPAAAVERRNPIKDSSISSDNHPFSCREGQARKRELEEVLGEEEEEETVAMRLEVAMRK